MPFGENSQEIGVLFKMAKIKQKIINKNDLFLFYS